MDEELALLRAIAANPYDDAFRGAYRDWLLEHDREDEAVQVAATFDRKAPASANWFTVKELVAKLLSLPLDAVPLVDGACSDEVPITDAVVALASEQKYVYRPEQGFVSYDARLYESDKELRKRLSTQVDDRRFARDHGHRNPYKGQKPNFVTVVRLY